MIELLHLLQEHLGWKIPAVFFYTSTRMALAAITSLLLSIFLGPRFIAKLYQWKIGQPIRKEECPVLGDLHSKKADTPTMGGVLILACMVASLALFMNVRHAFTLILLLTTLGLGAIGATDDLLKLKRRSSRGLPGRFKLSLQVGFSLLLTIYLLYPNSGAGHEGWFEQPFAKESFGDTAFSDLSLSDYITRLYVPFFKKPLLQFAGWGLPLFGLLSIFVVAGTSNAVNLADGLDGLATGLLTLVSAALAAVAFVSNNMDLAGYLHILYIDGSSEIAIYLSACIGACLGFLWYNSHPAQVFMGDTGSLALGGVIGVSALLLGRELLLALVGGVFVAETLSVMIQVASFRLRNQKRVFLCSPLHHHFEYKGWPETKVVIRFWIIGLLLAIVGVASLKFQ